MRVIKELRQAELFCCSQLERFWRRSLTEIATPVLLLLSVISRWTPTLLHFTLSLGGADREFALNMPTCIIVPIGTHLQNNETGTLVFILFK